MIIVGRLFYIQIIKADDYEKLAKTQHEAKYSLKPDRGNIYDRKGRLIASSVRSLSFALDPTLMKDSLERQSFAGLACESLELDSTEIIERIYSAKGSFVWIARGIKPNDCNKLDTFDHPAFIIKKEPRRNYLFGRYGSQLIGCTDVDNRGLAGIERRWDSLLKGRKGFIIMNRDARGRLQPAADLPRKMPRDGYGLELTIDIDLQRIAQYELKKAVRRSSAASGSVIAMDPSTGEILAMASYPDYDPNDLSTASDSSMKNRAVTDTYEPGSTFKLITASAALEEDIIQVDDIVDGHDGILEFKDYTLKDEHPLGEVPFSEAVVYSSNIVFSNLGNELPDGLFYKYIRDYGFGNPLGIDVPGEAGGSIKTPDEYDIATKRFLGFGYSLTVTPLQILNSYATVANDGKMMKPYTVKKILSNKGEPLKIFEPVEIRKVISKETAKTLTELLIQVVDRGTGENAKVEGIEIAGKTGTAQQYVAGSYKSESYTASFAGFFPAKDPKVAMVIVLDKPKGNYYGGSVAAPVFREICSRWLNIGKQIVPKIHEISDSVYVPNIIALTVAEAEEILSGYDLFIDEYEKEMNIILKQDPGAGEYVQKESEIYIEEFDLRSFLSDTMPKDDFLPDLRGVPVKRAIELLHKANIEVKVFGSGTVREQKWQISKKPRTCVLICK